MAKKEAENTEPQAPMPLFGGRKAMEEALAKIWEEVLRLPHVEPNANFFEIGGDSLKAMEVIVRVSEVLHVELPLIAFFEGPTVSHLADVLSGGRKAVEETLAQIWAEVLHIRDVDKDANFFEIGGDSLKAMDVIVRVSEVLHVDLPLIAFFEGPTVSHLASVLSGGRKASEEALATIWEEVLHLPRVETDANFFDIGGDSLKAMEVIVRVSETLRVDLPLIAFFEEPTVAHLATVVDDLKAAETTAPITRVAERHEFPLSYAQQVFWLLEQQNPGTGVYNTARVYRIRGKVDAAVLERSLNELRRRHEILRVRFVVGANGPVQAVDPGAPLQLALTDFSAMDAEDAEQASQSLALETVREPFDLENGPVIRARLIRLAAEEWLLCAPLHHVVSDGFSGAILLNDLGTIYDAFAAGEPNPLPELKLHFTDYAAWEQQWMQGPRLERELEYWRPVLQGAPSSVDLPTDTARGSEADRRGRLRSATIPSELLQRLQALAQANGTTLFTVLAAALRGLLYRWSGQTDFLLGTISSNRSRSGAEGMIGCFVNPLPLRNPVTDGQSMLDLLNREKNAVMDAFAHQDCPFAKIVEAVNPERTSSDNPLFNVALLLQNFPVIARSGRFFDAEVVNFDAHVALLDLRFVAMETRDGLLVSCEYKTPLFSEATVDLLLQAFAEVLEATASDPAMLVRNIVPPEGLVRQAESRVSVRQHTIATAATFTAEPIQEPLEFWMKQLGLAATIRFALYNQVVQQLLDPASLLSANEAGTDVILLRIEDLQAEEENTQSDGFDLLKSNLRELSAALRAAAKRSRVPYVVCLCPPFDAVRNDPHLLRASEDGEALLVSELSGTPGVQIVTSSQLLELYPVADYNDEYGWEVGHIPYKPALFTALASQIARQIHRVNGSQREVIVLGCDGTLWKGACTELGPLGVQVDEAHAALQDFMIAQQVAGRILCVCGSNTNEDITAVFDNNPAMRLGWEHVALSHFELLPQSANLKQLADELGLGMDRFIYVDSDPTGCGDVRANCPEVLVAQLPASADQIPNYLRHFWPFDQPAVGASAAQGDSAKPAGLPEEQYAKIASQLSSIAAITEAIESEKVMLSRGREVYAAPRSPVEELLADIWSRLLRIESPGIHDNFFALGGHSLMAVQVVARVRQTLGAEMPLRAMFEAPTIAQFAERIETARRASTGMVIPPLKPAPRQAELPPSLAQQRLWFMNQLEPDSPLYNISQMYRLRGPLQVEVLVKALNEIVRRHESLRSSFYNVDGQPVQVISPAMRIPLRRRVVSGSTSEEREAEIRRLAHEEAVQPFDLTKSPLIRAVLLRGGDDDHVLQVTLHHIVGDGWSGNLIADEISALYEAFALDRPSPLPELAVQYADFAVWQREWMQGEIKETNVAYWRQQLADAPAVLELPTDHPRPPVQRHAGDLRVHMFPRKLVDRLRVLSQSEGATLFMTLMAGFQLLLNRYSGQEDIVVGTPVAGRNYAEIEPLIGFFVNTLALRSDLSGDPTFRELLARVKQVALDAYAHQDIPFERLIEDLQPERSLSYNPIFQVLFNLQSIPKWTYEVSGLRIERSSVHQSTSLFDMSWFAFETPEGLLLRVEYDTDLFEESTVARAIDHFQKLLEGIVEHPESRISEFSLLGEEEQHRILVEFNQTAADYPKNDLLHDFVARQAARTPDAPAIIFGDVRVTYCELNARANQIAHYLMKCGAGPEVPVGIYCERSADMLVAILGVIKSGSAYVPLDPNYPTERIQNILTDSHAPVVITQKSLADDLPNSAVRRICLDADWPAISREPQEDPVTAVRPGNLAYVLFTSGSTGRPKGVAIEHCSAATFVHWANGVFSPQELAGVLLSTSICFDLSVFEIFVTWSAGGQIIVAENALYLPTLPAKSEVTLINTVPSAMAELVRMDGVPDSVKVINLAGEALPEALVEQIYSNTAVNKVYNLYGPTEDTTYSTYTLVHSGAPVTIGRPIANSQVYIVDAKLRPVPIGVPGELYLAGEGLARGYYGRDDLTADRFVPNPFSSELGARMYRTGDLARFQADGNIEYLGRIDHQVKLRGFRIELGEIENALESHPHVRQSVVVAREDVPGDKRLVAYVVPDPSTQSSEVGTTTQSQAATLVPELRSWLSEKLPEFMMPSAFVVLDAMPLSPNGKIDRRALPIPERSGETETVFVASRTPVEEKLSAIWSAILHVPKIGVHDNFFALGGHSLLATQVVSRIQQWAQVELPLRALFEAPTIGELALRIEGMTVGSQSLRPVQRVPRDRPLPLSFAQQRLWFLNQLEPDNPHYNIPMAIRLSGALDVDSLRRALNEIVRRHEVLRTTYVLDGDAPVQMVVPQLKIDVAVVDLRDLPEESQEITVRRMAIENGRLVFNLQTGPVIRASLLKLGEQSHVLLLNTHHIANDGWSIWQFANELAPLYEAYLEGKPSPLPELPVQYADFAVWQQNFLHSDTIAKQLDYWKKQMAGAPDTLALPTDRLPPAVLSSRGATEKVIFSRRLTDRLIELSRREGATLFMTLLAAYSTLLHRYTRQDDIVIGSPIANRNRAEIEDLIGFFVNTLVMRTDVSGNPTFRELMHRVREVALGAYTNQDLPFEKLVEVLHPERELGRIPLFHTWFVLQNNQPLDLRLPGLKMGGIDVHNGTAKFELGLFATEKPDGLYCTVEYATDLFDAGTIKRLLGHYRVLLEAIVEDPDRRLDQLPLLTKEERHQVLVEWNDTASDFPREVCVHELFDEQAERTPQDPAVLFENSCLTYAELNRRANQLGHYLRARGVGPESLVGVYLERSPEMVVAVLGVLKAGGAYVPLDPAYPRERLSYILDDAQARIVITQMSLAVELPTSVEQVCLDKDWAEIALGPEQNPVSNVRPEHLAYALFTSGSTGNPKGCQIEHRNLFYYLHWAKGFYFRAGEKGTFPLFTSLAFDLTVTSLFLPLLRGRTLRIFHQDADVGTILTSVFAHGSDVDCVKLTPSHVSLMSQLGLDQSDVRLVIVGGEAFELSQAQFLQSLNPQMRIINEYGPTETTVGCVVKHVLPDEKRVLIGKPIDNTSIYILDPGLNPVPVGVPGEVYIASPGVARGYLNRPELTAERFITDPFSPDAQARMYKTGDLARWLPDGNIDYLGRIDNQVKIRGFRVELGEIETTLDSHPGVGQSVVMAREDVPGDKRLVAYVVPDPDYRGSDQATPAEALSTEQVSQWTEAFDEAYRRGGGIEEATFNITGWDSSYTLKPIPSEEMRVWVETTVERIKGLRPKSVWEIGCGTGLLLFRVAPGCERYYGTDISQTALSFLKLQLQRPELRMPQLTLERKAAHEFDCERTRGQFDAVVLNSVIQYFPDLDYLMKVLEGAVESVRPGGAVFVGDVRSFPLLNAFHTSVEVFKAEDSLSRNELWQRVQKGIRQEGELLVDPEFFSALRHRWPQITHVEIQLKRGRAHNELTRFRYDVVLHIGEAAPEKVDCPWLDWEKHGLTREALAEILQKTEPEMLGLTGVPNARLRADVAGLEWLTAEDGPASVGDLRNALESLSSQAVEPEDLWTLEEVLPYQVEIRASKIAKDGRCDVVLRRKNAQGGFAHYSVPRFPGDSEIIRPWLAYANNPLRQRVAGKLIPQLRVWVGGKLPEYMVPSAFVLLDAMPLTANGKVNRRALPAPDQSRMEALSDYAAPRNPLEEMVATIFADVLSLERVGIHDNFFELGGHSLSATQVVSRIRQNLHVELPVRTLFESPTVAGLSKVAEETLRGQRGMVAPPIVRVPRDQRLPLSFSQQRLWVLDQIEPNNPLYNMPRAIRLTGVLSVQALETALNGIVERHEVLRTTYGSEKGDPFQVIAPELRLSLPVIDLSDWPPAEREQEAQRIVRNQASTPFDLAHDSISRNVLLKMGEEDHVLALMTHHIASDGWSTGILLHELAKLYEAAVLDKPSTLPELPIQYADYTVWQRNWLQGEVLDKQLAYWRKQLEGAPPVLSLPTDRARPPKPTFRGAMHRFLLTTSLAEAIRTLSRQRGGTLFMTMLAAFQTLILHYTEQPDIVLGTDLANRTTVQTEALIGFFVNLLALRTDLSGDPTFAELLGRVREVALGAYAHQDVPFDKLVEELQPERSLSHNPLVQVLFVQQNTPRAAATMPGLEIGPFPLEAPSKFDMAVFVSETEKGVAGFWVYNPDLFDATTITRMAGLYQLVLEKATANPAIRLSELVGLLAEEEQVHRASQHKEFHELSLQKLKSVKRKAITRE